MTLVSVIMPTYNDAHHLRRSIASVINQTHGNFELIVVNDGSTDRTEQVLETLASVDNRLLVRHTSNHGVSHARNVGLRMASGSFITFVDSDDRLPSTALKTLLDAARSGADVVVGQYHTDLRSNHHMVRASATVDYTGTAAALAMLYTRGITSSVWGKLYRRAHLENREFDPDLRIAEDLKFNWAVLTEAQRVTVLPSIVYEYSENPMSATRTSPNRSATQVLSVLNSLRAEHPEGAARLAVDARSFVEALQILVRLVGHPASIGDATIATDCRATLTLTSVAASKDSSLPLPTRALACLARVHPRIAESAFRVARAMRQAIQRGFR